jgi:glycosyltransferase involved in cell wall biosynthesis
MLKIGLTLLVRDEIDIINQWYDNHESKADFICVTDNGSNDGTLDILKSRIANDSKSELIREPEQNYNQAVWVDRMINRCIANGCTHIFCSDADEIWHFDPFKMAESMRDGVNVYRLPCRLYVPTIWDDPAEHNPTKRMRHYVAIGRNQEEAQCIEAWGKVFFAVDGYTGIEVGNDSVFINGVRTKGTKTAEGYIAHYPNRSWDQFRNKVIVSGEAWRNSSKPKSYGWHIRQQYDHYFTGGIVGLKRLWYSMIEQKKNGLKLDEEK